MATVSLTLTADTVKVLKLKDAFEAKYGPKLPEESDREFMERHIKEMLRRFMIMHLRMKASEAAEEEFLDPFEVTP